jgi:hypothetical protein
MKKIRTCSEILLIESNALNPIESIKTNKQQIEDLKNTSLDTYLITDYKRGSHLKGLILNMYINTIVSFNRGTDLFDEYTITAMLEYLSNTNMTKYSKLTWDSRELKINNKPVSELGDNWIIKLSDTISHPNLTKDLLWKNIITAFGKYIKDTYDSTSLYDIFFELCKDIGISLSFLEIFFKNIVPIKAVSDKLPKTEKAYSGKNDIEEYFGRYLTKERLKTDPDAFVRKVVDSAVELGVPPLWLAAHMYIESQFNVRSKAKGSTACGLFGALRSSVKEVGADYDDYKTADAIKQLEIGLNITKKALGNKTLNSFEDLRFLGLQPSRLGNSLDYVWAEKGDGTSKYKNHDSMDTNSNNKITIEEFNEHTHKLLNQLGQQMGKPDILKAIQGATKVNPNLPKSVRLKID